MSCYSRSGRRVYFGGASHFPHGHWPSAAPGSPSQVGCAIESIFLFQTEDLGHQLMALHDEYTAMHCGLRLLFHRPGVSAAFTVHVAGSLWPSAETCGHRHTLLSRTTANNFAQQLRLSGCELTYVAQEDKSVLLLSHSTHCKRSKHLATVPQCCPLYFKAPAGVAALAVAPPSPQRPLEAARASAAALSSPPAPSSSRPSATWLPHVLTAPACPAALST
jgi:hypothetical protein